jgi:hypothetical protein
VANVEKVLVAWMTSINEQGGCITDSVLQTKALALAEEMREAGQEVSRDVRFGKQWVSAFKKRCGARSQVTHGEAGSAPMEDVELGREMLQSISKEISPGDFFNMDETGFNYRNLPKRTITVGGKRVAGHKLPNKRMTVALTANADGSERWPMLVIHKYKRPRCFGRWTPSSKKMSKQNDKYQRGIQWHQHPKAWMTGALWDTWCSEVNSFYCAQKRTIWLVCDNCPCHTVPAAAVEVQWTAQSVREHLRNPWAGTTLAAEGECSLRGFIMSNLCVIFLPPNTTSHIQPMDQGIIAAFKAHYRKQHIQWHVQQLDLQQDTQVTIQQALLWAHIAWDEMVTRATIRNCWRKSGLLAEPADQQAREARADEERIARTKHAADMNNLTELLSQLRAREPKVHGSESTTPVDAAELLACDAEEETVGTVDTYADYLEVMDIHDDAEETMEDAEPEAEYDPPPPAVTLVQATAAAETLHTWTLQHEDVEEYERAVYGLCRKLTQQHVAGSTSQAARRRHPQAASWRPPIASRLS